MYLRNLLLRILIGTVVIVILGYASYRIYPLFSGPKIEITSPLKGEAITGNIIKIKGVVKRAKEVKIFDRIINLDPEGNFEEDIIKQEIYTDIVVTAKDKYGRVVTTSFFVQ